jgi:hypothetical protein
MSKAIMFILKILKQKNFTLSVGGVVQVVEHYLASMRPWVQTQVPQKKKKNFILDYHTLLIPKRPYV